MFKKLLLFFIHSFFFTICFAQNYKITGSVKDTSAEASVKHAVVALLSPKDSVLKAFTRVKEDGSFTFPNVAPGKYILSVTHAVFADFVDDIEINAKDEKLATISLTPKSKLLAAVIVKSGSPIRLRGDTTIYTADSFKVSANANVEELLKKMPGIQVDKNGQIKAMGQTVEKVLVDGEEFFGDDPGMAVKNLRADAVKEVQVFDKKSDQAVFTGIDDGITQKTINLKLKEDKKKGYFGKIDMAGGLKDNIDDRYNNNILLSSFKGKRKISGFLLTGNTGQDGLSWQDEQKFGGADNVTMSMDDDGGAVYMWRGGTADDEPFLDPQNGFITNLNAGVQYSNKWNEKTTVNFSPKYNSQRYNNNKQTFIQTQLGDSVLNENSAGSNSINRYNIKLRGTYDIKIDSVNTLKLTAGSNFYHTESAETRNGVTTGKTGTLKNASNRSIRTDSDKEAYSGNAIFKHKFKKLRRTLSLTADWNLLNTTGKNFLKSFNEDYFNNIIELNDQMKDYERTTQNISSKIVYTEPLGKKYALQLAYQYIVNTGNNEQITYTYSPGSAKYDAKVDSLSNQFKQKIIQNIPSATVNYSHKKIKVNAGTGVSFTDFELKDISFNKNYTRNYTNFFPSANLIYSYKSNHSLRVSYNGVTRQPTIDQLQPLRNNNDQFNQFVGNPDLQPSFSNNLNLSHNGYNFIKDVYMYQGINFGIINNAITNNRNIDPNTAKTITQPINTAGNYNLNFYGGAGFKLKKADLRLGFNVNGGINKNADFINSVKSNANSTRLGIGTDASKSKEKKYDLTIRHNVNYSLQTTSQNDNRIDYFINTFTFNGKVYHKKVWSLETEYELFARQKTAQVPAISNNLLSAKLQRTFKKDEYTFYLGVNDILNQNIGIERNFFSNTFTETRNDRLKRYWLLGFAWNFKNKAPQAK